MIDTKALPYRPCVGILLLNREGLAWIGKRHPKNDAAAKYAWQMPQGGIDADEDPLLAARRELFEETSIRSATLLGEAPDWLVYDFPPEILARSRRGKYRGQTQKWFAFRFDGPESEIDILNPPDGHAPEFCEWRWEKAPLLPDLVIPFKRAVYEKVLDIFSHLTR